MVSGPCERYCTCAPGEPPPQTEVVPGPEVQAPALDDAPGVRTVTDWPAPGGCTPPAGGTSVQPWSGVVVVTRPPPASTEMGGAPPALALPLSEPSGLVVTLAAWP